MPLIPGFNDTEEQIRAIADFAPNELKVTQIDLHPYNQMGEVKYERLGKSSVKHEPQSEEYIEKLKKLVEQ